MYFRCAEYLCNMILSAIWMRNCPDSVIKSQICMLQIYQRQRVDVWSLAACCLLDYYWLLSSLVRCLVGAKCERMNALFAKAIFGVLFASHTPYADVFFFLFLLIFLFCYLRLKIIIILINIEILTRQTPNITKSSTIHKTSAWLTYFCDFIWYKIYFIRTFKCILFVTGKKSLCVCVFLFCR